MVALEPVLQPFDEDLARHYEKLIDENVLPQIGLGSEGTVYSTGSHAIKIFHERDGAEEAIQKAHTNEKILEIAGIPVPRVRHIGNSNEGPILIMNKMPKLTQYSKLTTQEKETFDKNFNEALATAEKHGLTPTDLNKHTNCGWNKKHREVIFYDNKHWRLN
jgi:hypothetical protein